MIINLPSIQERKGRMPLKEREEGKEESYHAYLSSWGGEVGHGGANPSSNFPQKKPKRESGASLVIYLMKGARAAAGAYHLFLLAL